MRSVTGLVAPWLGAAAMICAFALSDAGGAAERRLLTTEGADYFGLDYDVRRGVDLDACKSACLAEDRCAAFTFNPECPISSPAPT